ncbi:hypothetical protein TRV_07424 [Trichophyton verrucosum HKI 0517]|uniref:3'-5' exonuclease domain-containing protein n=1 Tax=Trichophyton verrucosum (strain HKI 0517) TaxID=663202 RepID=D4DJQ6_TRIVH|nr:uncharacterized protein TRV_07424 [Trichophyton verrucosum HKI 0517]EFE37934.1 hypothetical protein TRV_07424 [Trichophyton verrucosum HKI 0517]
MHAEGMDDVFSTEDSTGTTLASIFECPVLRKAVFDVRGASDYLFHECEVTLDGIVDIQLMELATRDGSKEFLRGLATCICNDSSLSAKETLRWQESNDFKNYIFRPEVDESCIEKYMETPLRTEMIDHCAYSLVVLSRLYDVYDARLKQGATKFWKTEIRSVTKARINDTKKEEFDVYDRENAYGPWDEEELKMKMERRDSCPRGVTNRTGGKEFWDLLARNASGGSNIGC